MTDYAKLTDPTTLEIERRLPGPIERVWEHLVDPELRAKWLAGGTAAEQAGTKFRLQFDHRRLSETPAPAQYEEQQHAAFDCEILEYDPPHRLSFTWPDEGDATVVTVTLAASGDEVVLRLRHERLDSSEGRVETGAGWHAHLALLKDVLTGREPRDFWQLHQRLAGEYEERF